jgi:hypothetical protein
MGPPLHHLLRQILQGKQIPNSTIEDFISRHQSLKRYESSFHLLWEILVKSGINPPEASLDQIASAIIQLFQYSIPQARNAYSSMLLISSFEGIRFHPLLSPYKRQWNTNTEKYVHFYDPLPLLMELSASDSPTSISAIRDQLILASRFLCLYRSHDLANIKRVVSIVGNIPFIKI